MVFLALLSVVAIIFLIMTRLAARIDHLETRLEALASFKQEGHEWRPFPFVTVGVAHPVTREIAALRRQRDELQATTTRYLIRARAAERLLRLFREFVSRNATQWKLGAGHHHPIWVAIAGVLGAVGSNDQAQSTAEYQFTSPENTTDLETLESAQP